MEFRNVSKSYGAKKVFSSFSLTIREGRTSVITGASGIGKTTLMRLLLSLEKPDSGELEVRGRVSALFQEDRLIGNMSVKNNLLLVTDDEERALSMLEKAGLEGEWKSRVDTLSGGMKRRVALIRALLTSFDTMILDEPFTGLDDESKERMVSLLKEVIAGRTLIVITHDTDEYALLAPCDIIRL